MGDKAEHRGRGIRGAALPLACLFAAPAWGQTAPQTGPPPPSAGQLTPRSLAPTESPQAPPITIESAPPQTPKDAEKLSFRAGEVTLEGASPEQQALAAPVLADLAGHDLTVSDLYAGAAKIERRFAAAGYPLVRIVVPPQRLVDGGPVRLVFVDGYIEEVDLTNAPRRLLRPLRRIFNPLVGRRGLSLSALERRLTLADDLSGATIRSTLAPGKAPGGTRLIIQARHKLLSGSITFDNRQSAAFRGRNTTMQTALASPFGLGEQIYAYISADPWHGAHLFDRVSPRRTFGGGLTLPIGGNGTALTIEHTRSITQPLGGFFATRDSFARTTLRLTQSLVRTRKASLSIGPSIEIGREVNEAPDFGIALSRDRYLVARFSTAASLRGKTWSTSGGLTISYGIPDRRGPDDFPSRAGADGEFLKLEGNASMSRVLPLGFSAVTSIQGQKVLKGGVPSSELFALDGSDGITGVTVGALSADEGIVGRSELRRPIQAGPLQLQPFVYVASGRLDSLVNTPFDIGWAYGYGAGVNLDLPIGGTPASLFATVEYGQAHARPYLFPHRISVTAGVRF